MTAPIEAAYAALADLIAQTLVGAGFLGATSLLEVDPEAPFEPSGDETEVVAAAALVKVRTGPVRQMLGRPASARRYVVERECRLELAQAGPNREARLSRDAAVVAALAVLPDQDPTLGGKVERWILGEQADDELPPNGTSVFVTFTLRVRSADPLGRTA